LGVQTTLLILGIAFLLIVVLLSQLLINPPPKPAATKEAAAPTAKNYDAGEMLGTPQFYMLWLMFAFNAGAGLMVIGKLAKLVEVQTGFKAGFILVALLAIGNAAGRLLAGTLSDKFGRTRILQVFTLFQTALMFLTPIVDNAFILVIFAVCIGMNYGSNLALFPSITKDYFGLKNFGVNYGLVFTAWGVGGFILPKVSQMIVAATGTFDAAYVTAAILLAVSAGLSLFTKAPQKVLVPLKAQFAPTAQAGVTGPFFTHLLQQQAGKGPK